VVPVKTDYIRIDWCNEGNQGVVTLVSGDDGRELASEVVICGYSRTGMGEAILNLLHKGRT
jgi:hypothetical protein